MALAATSTTTLDRLTDVRSLLEAAAAEADAPELRALVHHLMDEVQVAAACAAAHLYHLGRLDAEAYLEVVQRGAVGRRALRRSIPTWLKVTLAGYLLWAISSLATVYVLMTPRAQSRARR